MIISHLNSTYSLEDKQLMLISITVMTFTQFVNFLIGIPINIYVIVLLSRAGGLDESVFFAVSQSVSEILFALTAPLYVLYILGHFSTIVMQFFNAFGLMARLMFQCLVCVERYLAVVHPVTFLKFKPLKYRLFCLIVAWVLVLTFAIILTFSSNFVFLEFFGNLFVVIVIMELFCFLFILKVLKQPAPGKREDSGMSSTKKKAFRIVCISLGTHLIQSVPMVVLFSIKSTLSFTVLVEVASFNMAMNIAVGLMPPFFCLHRAGKLTFTCKNNN